MVKKSLNKILKWELWPFYLIYAPLAFVWLFYAIRCGRFWFFSNVNPTLKFSGFEGDNKMQMYSQLPSQLYPVTVYINPQQPFTDVSAQISAAKLSFPLAVKPDAGTQGLYKITTRRQEAHK